MMALYSDLFNVMRIDQEETFAIVLIIVMHLHNSNNEQKSISIFLLWGTQDRPPCLAHSFVKIWL